MRCNYIAIIAVSAPDAVRGEQPSYRVHHSPRNTTPMLVLGRTFRLGLLAFRNSEISRIASSALQRPTLSPVVTRAPWCAISHSCRSTTTALSMSDDTVGGRVIRPLVPVSSVTAFGQGLGQEELEVGEYQGLE